MATAVNPKGDGVTLQTCEVCESVYSLAEAHSVNPGDRSKWTLIHAEAMDRSK